MFNSEKSRVEKELDIRMEGEKEKRRKGKTIFCDIYHLSKLKSLCFNRLCMSAFQYYVGRPSLSHLITDGVDCRTTPDT